MRKKVFVSLGVVAIIFAYVMSLNYAANDYGIVKNSLSVNVLAQDNTTGSGDGGTGTGTGDESGGDGETTNDSGSGNGKKYAISSFEDKYCEATGHNGKIVYPRKVKSCVELENGAFSSCPSCYLPPD